VANLVLCIDDAAQDKEASIFYGEQIVPCDNIFNDPNSLKPTTVVMHRQSLSEHKLQIVSEAGRENWFRYPIIFEPTQIVKVVFQFQMFPSFLVRQLPNNFLEDTYDEVQPILALTHYSTDLSEERCLSGRLSYESENENPRS
jgi:hypothetical protein